MCKKTMSSGAGAGAAPKQAGSETLPDRDGKRGGERFDNLMKQFQTISG